MTKYLIIASLVLFPLATFAANGTLAGESDPYELVDVCANVEGNQPVVPEGNTRKDNQCYSVTNGGGFPLCMLSGTCPCLGSMPGTQMEACMAQFYPKGCIELAPRNNCFGFPLQADGTYLSGCKPEPVSCARWASGYGPAAAPVVAEVVTVESLRQRIIDLIGQLVVMLQAELVNIR